ncbi:cytochrome P450 [Streptosporangium pseudovulgare]|uniref:Cytochrome P450 n=1 Tax=Streptosporangium pseudovulgare TaxID=35765 RepID=A0ABQ2R7Z2_9ACTN|nr:cytochrome P450 [Streptosporangium pseudovulgare]GGQ18339.1 cytochrome P450 [Streptosporangium pseudovulgare]
MSLIGERTRPAAPAARRGTRPGGTGAVPPGPPFSATPGLFAKLVTDRIGLFADATARYGDAVRLSIGPKSIYLFNHPDHAKHVLADNSGNYHKGIGLSEARRVIGDGLLTSEGELWRAQRRTIQPMFQNKRITHQDEAVAQEAAGLVARLRAHAGGPPVDIAEEMTGLTLGVLGRTLLDADLGAFGSIGHSFEAVQDQAMFEMVSLSMVPLWLPLPGHLRFRRARRELYRVADHLLASHLRSAGNGGGGGDGDGLVARLLGSGVPPSGDPRAAHQRLREELVTLLLAGHETTASTLSWAFHLIDRHPEVGERLREEAVAVLGDRLPRYEDLHRLRYTAMVVEEVMRLYPPVWALTRKALAADEVGGYHVPAGADVVVSTYTLHRHPAFWDDPDRFDPERFDPERPAARPRYAYIPFGAGPRFCVGNHLGMMEATFVIAMVARELRLAGLPGREAFPEAMLSLRVRGGLPMTVRAV